MKGFVNELFHILFWYKVFACQCVFYTYSLSPLRLASLWVLGATEGGGPPPGTALCRCCGHSSEGSRSPGLAATPPATSLDPLLTLLTRISFLLYTAARRIISKAKAAQMGFLLKTLQRLPVSLTSRQCLRPGMANL